MAPPGPNKWIGVREELCQVVLVTHSLQRGGTKTMLAKLPNMTASYEAGS
jgi:hypothetical protein